MAARIVLLHVAGAPAKPTARSSACARDRGVDGSRRFAALVPGAAAMERNCGHSHQATTEQLIARERAIADRREPEREIQPGLFESRAIDRAEASEARDALASDEHRRRIVALSRHAEARLTCTPVAVLISWR